MGGGGVVVDIGNIAIAIGGKFTVTEAIDGNGAPVVVGGRVAVVVFCFFVVVVFFFKDEDKVGEDDDDDDEEEDGGEYGICGVAHASHPGHEVHGHCKQLGHPGHIGFAISVQP